MAVTTNHASLPVAWLNGIFRELVPLPQDRTLLTWKTAPKAFAYMIPLYAMAYLVRRRDTHLLRLLLMPVVVILTLRCTFGYDWFEPRFYFYTWMRGLAGMQAIAQSLEFAFAKDGLLKSNEKTLPAVNEKTPQENAAGEPREHQSKIPLPTWLLDALEVSYALRRVGWKVGKGIHIPKEYRPLRRGPFLRSTLFSFIKHSLIMDFLTEIFMFIPGVNNPKGGSIFYTGLPPVWRYTASTLITLAIGIVFISGLQWFYDLTVLGAVGVLRQPPSAWPPLTENPWGADSLHVLWAQRWHQLMRRFFLVLGGYPGHMLAGRPGLVLGTFIVSGLHHEFGLSLIGKGLDHRVTLFFAMQGVGIILEGIFKAFTGRKVSGLGGRLWVYLFVLGFGQICVDAWTTRGLMAAPFVPAVISPTRRILMPLVMRLLSRGLDFMIRRYQAA